MFKLVMVIIAKIVSLGVIPKSTSTFFDLECFRVSNAFLKLMNIKVNFYEQEIPYEKKSLWNVLPISRDKKCQWLKELLRTNFDASDLLK